MNRQKKNNRPRIVSQHGEVFVNSAGISMYYRYRHWIIKVNPKLLLPCFRKDHRKKFYDNGHYVGYGEYRNTYIPMQLYRADGSNLAVVIFNFIREVLGMGCNEHERGYFLVKVKRYKYIILKRVTLEGNILCKVYHKTTGTMMGSFIYDKTFTRVYPSFSDSRAMRTLFIIMGYITDAVIYSTVASELNRTIEVVYD